MGSPRTISVAVPARNEAATVAGVLEPLVALRDRGALHELVLLDDSTDGTAEIARDLGVDVLEQRALDPHLGPVRGKGDALWRSLGALTGDVVVWIDADCTTVTEHYVHALTGPLLEGRADLVKGFYRRPFAGDPAGGGRVNHLVARPLLRRFFPALGFLHNPLAGETAITRDLALRLPVVCGFGVEVALLIDAHRAGARIRQCDLGVFDHRHKPLRELEPMADEVLDVVLARASHVPPRALERPPRALAAARAS